MLSRVAILVLLLTTALILKAETPTADSYGGGDGSIEDPYQISNLSELRRLSETSADWDSNFIVTKSIDATETLNWNDSLGFSPIGIDGGTPFSGSFDGNNFEIKNLVINRVAGTKIGFFGVTDNALISNVALTNCSIEGNTFTGALVGIAGSSTITNCHSSGTVKSGNVGGGLIGQMSSTAVSNSYSSCTVTVVMNGGGFIGISRSTIDNCFATGDVTASSYSGGFVGQLQDGTFTNCFSSGSTVKSGSTLGGFAGYMTSGSIVSCYYDLTKTAGSAIGNTSNSELTGLTTEQFKNEDNFTDWDFTNIWKIVSFSDAPRPFLTLGKNLVSINIIGEGDVSTSFVLTDGTENDTVIAIPSINSNFIMWLDSAENMISTEDTLVLTAINKDTSFTAVFAVEPVEPAQDGLISTLGELRWLSENRVEQDTKYLVSPPSHTTAHTGRYTAVH